MYISVIFQIGHFLENLLIFILIPLYILSNSVLHKSSQEVYALELHGMEIPLTNFDFPDFLPPFARPFADRYSLSEHLQQRARFQLYAPTQCVHVLL